MSYHPSGPEGLRLLARFFEEVLNDHACFDMSAPEGEVTVEEDLRRWADEMEQANEKIATLQAQVDRMGPYQVGLCQCKLDHAGIRPHTEKKTCMYWMALAKESN